MVRLSLSLCLGLASLALLVASGSGQDKKETKVKGTLPPGWKALNLSAEQKDKVYGLRADFKAKIIKLEEQIKDLKSQEKAELFKVLSDEQKTLLRKLALGEDGKEKKSEEKK